jgi:hypothetical protein
MCAAPISAGDAAWTAADADWERLQVAAADAFAVHDLVGAAAGWAAALRVARVHFEKDDPRLAASLTNQAFALRLQREPVADRLFTDALEIWDAAPAWLARQSFVRRARTSAFHLRLEARHGGAYDENLRRRAEAVVREARAASAALAGGAPARPPDRRAFRSAPLDAMRKVLAAAHLLAGPAPEHDARGHAAQEGS